LRGRLRRKGFAPTFFAAANSAYLLIFSSAFSTQSPPPHKTASEAYAFAGMTQEPCDTVCELSFGNFN
jgi:hypothetical protein